MQKEKTVLMIGANSDIAESFLKKYSLNFEGLVLASRDIKKTKEKYSDLPQKNITIRYIDLSDEQNVISFLNTETIPYGVIFFAGHLEYDGEEENKSFINIRTTIAVNYLSPVIIFENISERMRKNGGGFILYLSSAGDVRGKYSNRFYVSSKRATVTYLQGLMQINEKFNVKTYILKLGHIDTKMLKKIEGNRTPIFVATPEKTADYIYSTIKRCKSCIKYYRPIWGAIARIYGGLPAFIYFNLKF